MNQSPWIEFEKAIYTQLELQVRLSLNRHHGFMIKHGLSQCKHVADIGTGNGLFLGEIARQNPAIRFYGIDDKSQMIKQARKRNETNTKWIQSDALHKQVQTLLSTCEGILMRYFVLHMPDTGKTLPQILSQVKQGTHLWIFDLDPDYDICEPRNDAFDSFRDLVSTFCKKNSIEIRIGSMLPPILENAGFEVVEVSAEPFNNLEIDPRLLAEYLYREAYLYDHFLEGIYSQVKLNKIRDFFFNDMNRGKQFVQYGMAMISAVKK